MEERKSVLDDSSTLMEQVPYQDYYDYSDIDLETYVVNKYYVDSVLQCLTPRELEIVKLYYYQRYTFEEIGKMYNITRGRAQRIMVHILFKLRRIALSNKSLIAIHGQASKNTR